jgi:hypothetical protein
VKPEDVRAIMARIGKLYAGLSQGHSSISRSYSQR